MKMTEFLSTKGLFVDIERTHEWHYFQNNIRIKHREVFRADLKTRAGKGFVSQMGIAVSGYGETEQEAINELVNAMNQNLHDGASILLELPSADIQYGLARIDLLERIELDIVIPS
jgi:hypothetical protein